MLINKTLLTVLGEDWEYYVNQLLNNKNYNTLYHNTEHCLKVANKAIDIIVRDEEAVEVPSAKKIILAAMFHDYGHLNDRKYHDSENLKVAKGFFKQISKESEDDTNEILTIMDATQYPYLELDLSFGQKIIRDADMFYFMWEDNWFRNFLRGNIVGLSEEWKDDSVEFFQGNIKHWESVVPFTEVGKQDLEKVKEAIMDTINIELDIRKSRLENSVAQ